MRACTSTTKFLTVDTYGTKELKLFAIDACVVLSTNLWTKTGLVNGAYGVVKSILKPVTDSNAHVFMVDFPNHRGLSLVPYAPTVIPITQIRSKHFTGLPLSLSWAITIQKSQWIASPLISDKLSLPPG